MKKIISTNKAPEAIGTYSQAVAFGDLVFISGQIPLDPKTMQLKQGFVEQTHQVFKNIQAIIEEAGGTMNDVIKLNISVVNLDNFATLNEIMGQYFTKPYPARAAVQVVALPKNSEIEIETILGLKS